MLSVRRCLIRKFSRGTRDVVRQWNSALLTPDTTASAVCSVSRRGGSPAPASRNRPARPAQNLLRLDRLQRHVINSAIIPT